jgi:hypothetical protein
MRRPYPTRPRLSRACACDPVRARSVRPTRTGALFLSRQTAAASKHSELGLGALLTGSPASPVAVESGKRKNAKFRWACNKRLRKAFGVLAHSSTRWNAWAAERYASARARGHSHQRALRTLGRAWSRIIWRCWQTHTPYDPKRHTACNSTSPPRSPSRRALGPTSSPPSASHPAPSPHSPQQQPANADHARD